MRRFLFALLLAALSHVAFASFSVLPPGSQNTEGDGFNRALTMSVGQSRRYQWVVDSSAVGPIAVGDQITGISFRADIQSQNPATWPPTNATFSSFVLSIGSAATTAATASTVFANNRSGVQSTVYSGSYTIPQDSYLNNGGTGPNPWGPELVFQTPFTYSGGNLCFEFVHSGTDIATSLAHDAVTDNASSGVRAIGGNSSGATAGNITSFTVSRLSYTSVPEPSTVWAVLFGGSLVAGGTIRSRRIRAVMSK